MKKFFFLIAIISSNILLVVDLYSQQRTELEKKRIEKQKEIENVENLVSKTKHEKNLSFERVALLNKKIILRNELIDDISNEISEIENRVNILNNNIDDKFDEITTLKNEYAKIVYNSYFRFRSYNNILFLISSESINQAYRRLYFLKQYTKHRNLVLNEITEEVSMIQSSIKILNFEKERKFILLTDREEERKKLSIEKNEQNHLIESNSKKEEILLKELKDLQIAEKKIESEIERIIKEEALAKVKKTSKVRNDDVILTKNFNGNKGKLPWPIENGTIISNFGEHPHPLFKGIIIKNNGIDISGTCNNPVHCVFNGVISKIFAIKGSNFVLIIRHGDFLTVYQNIQNVNVQVGDNVKTGQTIGFTFCSNGSEIATLHFEIWQELTKLNPVDWLRN